MGRSLDGQVDQATKPVVWVTSAPLRISWTITCILSCLNTPSSQSKLHTVRRAELIPRFIPGMVDSLNAEISLGTIANVPEAIQWLGYTYLFGMWSHPTYCVQLTGSTNAEGAVHIRHAA